MIKLVPITDVKASEYNPRKNDEKRLALTEMSLRKLGFLLPIYADTSGEILSGHQRHLVATRMGFTRIPVQYVNNMDLNERKTVNILFNRATNDLSKQDTCDKIKSRLYNMDIQSMCEALPDIEPDSEASFPCVYAIRRVDTTQLAKVNHRNFDSHIAALAKTLERSVGSSMPIVIGQDMNVVNGIGRLQVAAEAKRKFVQCVQVTKAQEEFSSAMLNLLSMDFSMESSYADVLRYNSFMRERNTRETDTEGNCAFGDGFFKGLFPNNNGRDFFKLEGEALEAWKNKYGDKIVDFGAGKLNNTRTLRNAGVFVSAFEPYFVTTGDTIHKEKSIEIANKFLDEVESGVEYTSVFISSVFNSVPFMEDRIKIAQIAAALCSPGGRVVCWCQSMIEVCRDKFSVGISGGYVELVNGNFFDMDIPDNQSLVLSILSMQFMPTAYRQNMINSIYEALNPGGAFVFVEKIIADEGTDDLNVDLYYQMKRENGYTEEKIMQKRKSLENVLSPLKAEWNEDMLHEAGFEKVDMFWRCLNFCGWVAIK